MGFAAWCWDTGSGCLGEPVSCRCGARKGHGYRSPSFPRPPRTHDITGRSACPGNRAFTVMTHTESAIRHHTILVVRVTLGGRAGRRPARDIRRSGRRRPTASSPRRHDRIGCYGWLAALMAGGEALLRKIPGRSSPPWRQRCGPGHCGVRRAGADPPVAAPHTGAACRHGRASWCTASSHARWPGARQPRATSSNVLIALPRCLSRAA